MSLVLPGEEDQVSHCAHEDEDTVEGEGDEEQVEISVVPLAHAVTNPRAVVVKPVNKREGKHLPVWSTLGWPFNTVVTYRAVTCSGRPEYLAGEAELELYRLALHLDLLRPGRRSVCWPHSVPRLLDLSLNILGFCYGRSNEINALVPD